MKDKLAAKDYHASLFTTSGQQAGHEGKRIFASDANEIDNDVMKDGYGKVPERGW